ncbi:DMT family transporter [Pleomorphomonas sp. JP5]|uniref:DMT family transporter n=1 Tax=Pleomorphomonas sp. JP5 TaxID=2942998 RepID=UPI00204333A9|nr:EamA family transporter [Pleomorphomonas sp. JP5]MCM5557621.1 EamA family transporter [Pleomorphomonas sp. JP5]
MTAGRSHLLGALAIVVSSILWGTTGTAATFAPEVGAMAIGAAAMGIGGLLQALIAAPSVFGNRSRLRSQWRFLALGAATVAVYPLTFYASMRMAGVTIGTVISIGSAPLFAALIERRVDGSSLSRRWLAGAGLGLVGMALIGAARTSGHAMPGAAAPTLGVALGLFAGLTYATYSWSARKLMQRGVPSLAAMGAIFGGGGLLLMPVLAATGAPFLWSWNNALVGIYMAAVPMFLGYVCFGYGLARVQASMATTITLLEPVVAAALAVIVVGERLPAMGWIGVALVVACLIFITIPGPAAKPAAIAAEPFPETAGE